MNVMKTNDLQIAIWGTGKRCHIFLSDIENYLSDVSVSGFIETRPVDSTFNGLPLLSIEELEKYSAVDYIVVTPLKSNEIYDEVKEKYLYLLSKLITIPEFYTEYIYRHAATFRKLKAVFYGDKKEYMSFQIRAETLFGECVFADSAEQVCSQYSDFDLVILLTSLVSCAEQIEEDENRMRQYLSVRTGFSADRILGRSTWGKFILADRRIDTNGEGNPDKTFFVIGTEDRIRGWGNLLVGAARNIAYAKSKGFIPIIDMQNFPNQYLSYDQLRKHNSWNDFFKDINEVSLSEVYKSKNVIVCGVDVERYVTPDISDIKYNARTESYINERRQNCLKDSHRSLGVIYRGTDYHSANHETHPIVHDIYKYMDYIDVQMKKYKCDNIFLATEVSEAVEVFRNHFGDRLTYTDQRRYSKDERRFLSDVHFDRDDDYYMKGAEYLAVLDILSRCNALIGQDNGTFRGAQLLNQGRYEHVINITDMNL